LTVEIRTGRGIYRLIEAAPATIDRGAIVLTLALERADGIERVVLRCRIDQGLVGAELAGAVPLHDFGDPDELIVRLQPWVEHEFEIIREAALKSIRSERKLHEVVFDNSNRGPF